MGDVDAAGAAWDPIVDRTGWGDMDQGNAIRGGRARLRMTQSSLAGAAGMSLNTVKRAEAGLPVQDESIRNICAVLELDVAGFPRATPSEIKPESPRNPSGSLSGEAADPGQEPSRDGPGHASEWSLFLDRCRQWDPSPEIRFLIALGLIGCIFVPHLINKALVYVWGLSPVISAPPPALGWLDTGAVNLAFSTTMIFALMLFMGWSIVGMMVCELTGNEHPLLTEEGVNGRVPAACLACFFLLLPLEGNWGVFQQIALTLTGIVLGTENLSWTVGPVLVIGQILVLLRFARTCNPLLQGPPLIPLGLTMGFLLIAPTNGLPLPQVIATIMVFACAAAWRRPATAQPFVLNRKSDGYQRG